MELVTPRLILRELRHSDFEAIREYESHPEIQRYEQPVPDDEATRAWLEQSIRWAQQSPRTHYRWGITVQPDDTVRGHLSLALSFEEIREWEIGWTVHDACCGRGYATEAATAVLTYAFGELHAHRVVAFCNAANVASARVMEKIGMRRDGLLRETRWLNGAWADECVYAILEKEWDRLSERARGRKGTQTE